MFLPIIKLLHVPGGFSSREGQQARLHTDSSSSEAELSEFQPEQRKSGVRAKMMFINMPADTQIYIKINEMTFT